VRHAPKRPLAVEKLKGLPAVNSDVTAEVCPRESDLSWREVDGSVVILDLRNSAFLDLNASGSFLWLAMTQERRSALDLAQILMSRFGLEEAQAMHDVTQFIARLSGFGLLTE
jgi:Coenzyme PQQ synthesis protein D (PqqD)